MPCRSAGDIGMLDMVSVKQEIVYVKENDIRYVGWHCLIRQPIVTYACFNVLAIIVMGCYMSNVSHK